MKGKKGIIQRPTLIVEQSPIIRRMGYFLTIMGLLSLAVLIPEMKLENIKRDSLPILIIVLLLLIWVFIYVPYKAITTNKQLTITGDKFVLKSNKKKYSINTNLENMIWWRKISANPGLMDLSNKIQIKFKSKKVILNALEFTNFYELESFFEVNYQEKEKKASR